MGYGISLNSVGQQIGMCDRRSTLSFRACAKLHPDGKWKQDSDRLEFMLQLATVLCRAIT